MSENSVRRREAKQMNAPIFEKRHVEILAAAAEVFRAKGFAAANMQDVADRLGVDRSSLYYYFANKNQLFHTLIRQAVLELTKAAEDIRDLDVPSREKLRLLIYSQVKGYADHYEALMAFIQEDMRRISLGDPGNDEDWNATALQMSEQYDRIVVDVVQAGLDDGSFVSPVSARVVAYAIQGMGNWMTRWYRPDGSHSLDEIAEGFVQMTLDGLRPRGGRRRVKQS